MSKKKSKIVTKYETNRIFDYYSFLIIINITAMKTQHSSKNILLGISFFIILAFTAMAFQDSSKVKDPKQYAKLDTVPKNNNIDIDIEMKDVDQTIKKSLEQAEKSLKEIDWNKIKTQVDQSMKQIDMAKLQMEIDKSMKAIDWNKMKSDIDRSMKEIDMSKIKMDIEKSVQEMKKVNFDDLKKEMEKLKIEMESNKDHFKMDMDKFKIDMGKLKIELKEFKEMTTEMEKDGLLNKNESNSIEYKNKELFINGKKQSQQAAEKYRKYFKGDNFKFNFKGD